MRTKIIIGLLTLIPFYGFSENNLAIQNYYKGDYTAAVSGLTELVDNKNGEAAFYLGKMYLQGFGVTKDTQKGLDLILQSAKKNYVPAQIFLAEYYLVENNNFDEAFNWFQKAADLGNVEAQMFCATSYLYGYGVTKNVEKARKYVIKAAQNGDTLAQYELAKLFLNNKRVKDQGLGVLWLNKAAGKGNANAQYLLGVSQLTGNKMPQDATQGIKWLKQSALQGNSLAKFALGVYYLTTNDEPNSIQQSTYWFNSNLINNSNLPNQTSTAQIEDIPKMFLNKKTNTDNNTVADLQKSAEEGNVTAAQQLGFKYAKGDGVPANKELAIKWLKIAAEKNDYTAKIQLAALQNQWSNPATMQQANVLTPKMPTLVKGQIFNQSYEVVNPNSLPIDEIISTLGKLSYTNNKPKLMIPTMSSAKIQKLKTNIAELTREADHGYAQSQYKLGIAYQNGIGVKKDIATAINWFQAAAEQNYSPADYAMGLLALSGKGMDKNYELAQSWLMKAAIKGNANAQFLLGQLYELGYGKADSKNLIAKNLAAAKIMYGLAAANNNYHAQYNLAQLYISGLLAENNSQLQKQNVKVAYDLLKQAAAKIPDARLELALFNLGSSKSYAEQQQAFNIAQASAASNNPEGKLLLALMYDRGVGTEANKQKAIELYEQLAEGGNPVAQYILGSDYALGNGIEKNMSLGRDYLVKASEAGLGYANYNLAVLDYQLSNTASFVVLLKLAESQDYQPASILLADYYLMNESDPEYIKQAVSIYQNLANNGNVEAQIKLAYMCQNGIYFPINYPAALAWYQKAAEQNSPIAQFALGEMYQLGQGVDRDVPTAMQWYEKAAKQNFAAAQAAIGYINEVDREDYQQARTWYELAAKNNYPVADYNLGVIYDYGKGVPVDAAKAKAFFESAGK